MATYIYVLRLIARLTDEKAWTKADEIAVEHHYQRIKRDYERGIVLHVGRTEDTGLHGFGIVIYSADSDQDAEQYMLGDPAVIGGQMTATYQRYKLIFR